MDANKGGRLGVVYLLHLSGRRRDRRRKAFERRGEDGAGIGGASGRSVEFGEGERAA